MFEFPKGEQRLSFYRPSPPLPHRYISTAATFSFLFSFFFSFPSLLFLREKEINTRGPGQIFPKPYMNINNEAEIKVKDSWIHLNARPLPDIDSLFSYRRVPRPTFLSFLIRDFFLKNRRTVCTWGGPGFRLCPRVILRTFRHTRYTDPFSYPPLFNTPFFAPFFFLFQR